MVYIQKQATTLCSKCNNNASVTSMTLCEVLQRNWGFGLLVDRKEYFKDIQSKDIIYCPGVYTCGLTWPSTSRTLLLPRWCISVTDYRNLTNTAYRCKVHSMLGWLISFLCNTCWAACMSLQGHCSYIMKLNEHLRAVSGLMRKAEWNNQRRTPGFLCTIFILYAGNIQINYIWFLSTWWVCVGFVHYNKECVLTYSLCTI